MPDPKQEPASLRDAHNEGLVTVSDFGLVKTVNYVEVFQEAAAVVGLGCVRPAVVFGAVVLATGLVGAAGGFWAWWVAGRVMRRLGERE